MIDKNDVNNLAYFGGKKIFATPKSTSNLLQPDIEKFLGYSRVFFEHGQYTNNGPNIRLLEKRLADFHQTAFCVTFSSGFWALALAIRALAIDGRNEIIMPSLTYRRMADIASWVNLKPHFCEVESDTLAMSVATVEPCINENTALILGVHPIVNCADSNALVDLARQNNIPILFDSVESVYESTSAGKVGGQGDAECFSLHACKLFNGFGGGYLTTNDENLAFKLASMRTFGFLGADNVAIVGGMNAKLNEIHAAMTLASLDDIEDQVALNRERYYTYKTHLNSVMGVRLLEFDEEYQTGYKNIVIELTDEWPLNRELTIEILNAENILTRPYYYPPLHRKPMSYPYILVNLSITDSLAQRFVNLPCGQLVSNDDIVNIVTFMNFIATNAIEISEHQKKSGAK
ncbi:MAG: aminotransferase class I/II-fold pyridoxal phosphate-dependent enzyme [Methylotenera sp.]|nr:aminotransferase class I/II-fold pyridoxal phosphate-dependent enzyme [Methylotenera sp.]